MASNTKEIIESSSCDSDDGDINMDMFAYTTSSSEDSADENGNNVYVIKLMPILESYSGSEFKTHFKFNRSTVEKLVVLYCQSEFLQTRRTRFNPRLQMYMFLWYITKVINFKHLAISFGVPRYLAAISIHNVSSFLVENKERFVKWPQGNIVRMTTQQFETKSNIPGVIGAIDIKHFKISPRTTDQRIYYNRKHYLSVILQAVVDANYRFTDIFCGEPGSLHDYAVLQRSSFFSKASDNCVQLFPDNTFILGHSGYPAKSWLVPPFRNIRTLTEQERHFNYLHSTNHMAVKNAFALLTGRFRRLTQLTDQPDVYSVSKIIESACVLHNVCLQVNDDYPYVFQEINEVPQKKSSHLFIDSSNRRKILLNSLIGRGII